MEIKVLGSGCSRCHKTLEVVNKVVSENHVDANVEYVTDLMKIMEYNVVSMPAIVIDGVVRLGVSDNVATGQRGRCGDVPRHVRVAGHTHLCRQRHPAGHGRRYHIRQNAS